MASEVPFIVRKPYREEIPTLTDRYQKINTDTNAITDEIERAKSAWRSRRDQLWAEGTDIPAAKRTVRQFWTDYKGIVESCAQVAALEQDCSNLLEEMAKDRARFMRKHTADLNDTLDLFRGLSRLQLVPQDLESAMADLDEKHFTTLGNYVTTLKAVSQLYKQIMPSVRTDIGDLVEYVKSGGKKGTVEQYLGSSVMKMAAPGVRFVNKQLDSHTRLKYDLDITTIDKLLAEDVPAATPALVTVAATAPEVEVTGTPPLTSPDLAPAVV
jgi:hypothetical protein